VSEELTDPAELNCVLRSENERLKAENKLLKEKVDLLIRRIFGVKSEQLDPAQLELLLSQTGTPWGKDVASVEPEATPLLDAVKVVPRKDREPCPRRERWPHDLPVLEEILEPEEVKARPEAFRCIGQEISETLDYEPARFLRRRLIRRKYVERDEAEEPPVIAPLPERLQQRCVAAPGLLAQRNRQQIR
jgi:transposase